MMRGKAILAACIAGVLIFTTGCGDSAETVSKMEELEKAVESKSSQITQQEKDLEEKNSEIEDLTKQVADLEDQVTSLNEKVEQAAPWFEMKEEERKKEEERLAAEKKAKEEQERQAREAEEKKGYETGITMEQLSRTPDNYKGKKVKFTGEVIQVLEGETTCDLRIAVNNDYDTILYVVYSKDIVSQRVLEDDTITLYGISQGLYTYESAVTSVTIPLVIADKIDQG